MYRCPLTFWCEALEYSHSIKLDKLFCCKGRDS